MAAKWAGALLTIGTSAYDNIVVNKEGNSMGRAVLETVGESAITIGLGIGVGAVVGLVGAPALVTGAITVGVLWGLDRASEALFGKNLAEAASDAILDTGKAVIEAGGKAIKAVGNAVSSAGKTIGGWFKKGIRAFA